MTKQYLLNDTNLSEVAFGSNGQSLVLTFLNMRDGDEEARLGCSGLLIVKYQSTCSSLPLYVGDVIDEIVGEDSMQRLGQMGYGFMNRDGTTLSSPSERLHFVHLEGGEIDIDIVCSEIEFNCVASRAKNKS